MKTDACSCGVGRLPGLRAPRRPSSRLGFASSRLGVAAVLLLMCSAAAGQMNPQQNAATWYQRAADQYDRLTDQEWSLLAEFDPAQGHAPTPEIRAALQKAQPLISLVDRGSRQQTSDFMLDRSQGLDMVLPPLTNLRMITHAMRTDAMVRLHDGDAQIASERVAAIYRASGHLGREDVMIGSLLGQSLFAMADQVVQHAMDRGMVDSNAAGVMLRAIEGMDAHDPFNFIGAIAGEQDTLVMWLTAERENMPLDALEAAMLDADAGAPELPADYSIEDFDADIERYDLMMDRMVDAFAMEDREAGRAEVETLVKELAAGEHGYLAGLLAPALGRCFELREQGLERVGARRESLVKLIEGDAEPFEVANAAVWYLRGISALERQNIEQIQTLRRFDAADDEFNNDLLDAIFPALGAMEVFRDGAAIPRCDFSIALPDGRARFLPPYLEGMRDAFRLLHADARRLFAANQPDAAMQRLLTSAAMIAHLSGDPQMLSAITAHAAFIELVQTISREIDSERLNREQRTELAFAMERIDRTDPFGYLAARRRVSEELLDRMRRWSDRAMIGEGEDAKDDDRAAAREAALARNIAFVEQADDAALLSVHALDAALSLPIEREFSALATYVTPADRDETEPEEVDRNLWPRHGLDDVLDIAQWIEALRIGQHVESRFARGELVTLRSEDVLPLNRLAERRSGARRDLREAVAMLRGASERQRDREATSAPFAQPDGDGR